jgi:hypothetical protein
VRLKINYLHVRDTAEDEGTEELVGTESDILTDSILQILGISKWMFWVRVVGCDLPADDQIPVFE